jgi:hypothetical protein
MNDADLNRVQAIIRSYGLNNILSATSYGDNTGFTVNKKTIQKHT